MKVNMIKNPGGTFVPASEIESEKLTKFKNYELYPVEIKLVRNPGFHRKAFAFFNFCFHHWSEQNSYKPESAQFDKFRKDLIILSGYYHEVYNIRGDMRLEAMSISFGAMSQEEFESLYNSLINAAMKHIFQSSDESIYNQLIGFF